MLHKTFILAARSPCISIFLSSHFCSYCSSGGIPWFLFTTRSCTVSDNKRAWGSVIEHIWETIQQILRPIVEGSYFKHSMCRNWTGCMLFQTNFEASSVRNRSFHHCSLSSLAGVNIVSFFRNFRKSQQFACCKSYPHEEKHNSAIPKKNILSYTEMKQQRNVCICVSTVVLLALTSVHKCACSRNNGGRRLSKNKNGTFAV